MTIQFSITIILCQLIINPMLLLSLKKSSQVLLTSINIHTGPSSQRFQNSSKAMHKLYRRSEPVLHFQQCGTHNVLVGPQMRDQSSLRGSVSKYCAQIADIRLAFRIIPTSSRLRTLGQHSRCCCCTGAVPCPRKKGPGALFKMFSIIFDISIIDISIVAFIIMVIIMKCRGIQRRITAIITH